MPTPWHDHGPDEVYDLASQLERTMMSWQRTALALGLNGALLLELAATDQEWLWPLGLLVIVAAIGLWAAAFRSYGRQRGRQAGHVLLVRRTAMVATACMAALSLVGALAVLAAS
jgi:putative membrane protein